MNYGRPRLQLHILGEKLHIQTNLFKHKHDDYGYNFDPLSSFNCNLLIDFPHA